MATEKLHSGQNTSLVTYTILTNGEKLSGMYHVMSLSVSKELNRIPTAKIVLLDGNAAKQDFSLSNLELFVPGNEIEIRAGYHSEEERIFKGLIIKHNLRIRSNQSYLIIECKDESFKLTIGRKNRYFYESKDSEVFEELIDKYGLNKVIESTKSEHRELTQFNVTDWDFMMVRMQVNGLICAVDDGTITVKQPDFDQEPLGLVIYGDNLFELDAEIDARNQFKKIISYGWNAANQELIEVEATNPGLKLNGNLSPDDLSEALSTGDFELRNGPENTENLKSWADAKALFQQLAKVRGRIKVLGSAKIKPDTTLELEGVGERFKGKVYISGVRHEITEGNWFTHVQFGMNPAWFAENYSINALPAAGLYPAVHGLQIGVVTQLEDDPEKEERILVNLPMVDTGNKGIWARLATLDAGENRGSFFLPEIGDEVVMGFVNDNPQQAVILGMLNSSAKPAPLTASDDNHEKGFMTRNGISFIFNDDKNSVSITTPGGKKIILDEHEGIVEINDENDNKVVLDADGISFDSQGEINLKAGGNINLEGMSIAVKANSQLKAEGSVGAEISTSGVAVIKGSVVQIN